ncbi:putative manganese transporter [Enterovibrio baiacu]|uniref:putative manganese transporter n=1 Tax=Enterovibrio baiacu TaxID=2491023 RepID=UPI003D13D2DD
MTTLVSKYLSPIVKQQDWTLKNRRLMFPVVLMALLMAEPTRAVSLGVLSDAFWQVAAYVAATLALFHYLTDKFDRKGAWTKQLSARSSLQVLFAAFMGALPGCGGAIVVITQYVRGNLSFGAVVAVLTATMGDAAFLLLATRPMDGFMMVGLGFVVGLISGVIVDRIHGGDFLRPNAARSHSLNANEDPETASSEHGFINAQGRFWQWLVLPAMVMALIGSFQMDADEVFSLPAGTSEILGAALAVITVTFWSLQREVNTYESVVGEDPKCRQSHLFQRVAQDTNFVTVWVIAAFLAFELTILGLDIELSNVFEGWGALMPLMGVAIGLLPGCGPQILVTSLYISGAVPMSAQVGNAISNDGDALFPAIALAPKAAMMATLYSTVPALVAAYGYFFLFE